MAAPGPTPLHRTTVIGAFVHSGRHYEQRLVDCGKIACTKCGGDGARHPSHGPYWYLCVSRGKRWTRLYIGKELDTRKFIGPDGSVDWSRVANRRGRRAPDQHTSKEIPGQLDMLDPKPPGLEASTS